jgi:hypothetical protein
MLAFVLAFPWLRPGSQDPAVGVFERGIVIGRRLILWRDLREIEYHPLSGVKEQRSVWTFSAGHEAPAILSVPAAGYVNASELSALLQERAELRVMDPE